MVLDAWLIGEIKATLANGQEAPMMLVRRKLIVGEALGAVPDETPMVPLSSNATIV